MEGNQQVWDLVQPPKSENFIIIVSLLLRAAPFKTC